MTAASNKSILESVLDWLRAGYPQGIPREDHVALYAVLHRRLTETEVDRITEQLMTEATGRGTGIDRSDIEQAIHDLARERPGADDVRRVASRLAAGGWPLANLVDG